MTREEQTKQYLKERNIPITSLEANSIIEGAKWADKTMIEKACEWLLCQEEMIGISFENDFIERFKKVMEE